MKKIMINAHVSLDGVISPTTQTATTQTAGGHALSNSGRGSDARRVVWRDLRSVAWPTHL